VCVKICNIQGLLAASSRETRQENDNMSQETIPLQEAVQISIKEETKPSKSTQVPIQEILDSLKSMQDDIGQISELTSEEKGLVTEFFESLLKLMQPLATTIPVSAAALDEIGNVVQANIDPTGHLIIIYRNGEVELKNLKEEKHRDLMLSVVKDIVPKFKQLTNAHRRKIENRMKFLSLVTKEMQKISKTFSAATASGAQR
jgi:hypothetical protein